MKFTFGIVTTDPSICNKHLTLSLLSIENQLMEDFDYEVIIIGGSVTVKNELLTIIPFDESIKDGWITKKKNLITKHAKYDNIVYMHDYISLEPDWYQGFKTFGDKFDICMTPIKNYDGSRFRDWTLWPHDITPDGSPDGNSLLPYDVTDLSKYMYISGAYWIAKKHVMEEFPLNEELCWGESEDVEWSKRVRTKYNFSINPHSSVQLLKYKNRAFNEATQEKIKELRNHDIQPK